MKSDVNAGVASYGGSTLESYQYLGLDTIMTRTRPTGIPSLPVQLDSLGRVCTKE